MHGEVALPLGRTRARLRTAERAQPVRHGLHPVLRPKGYTLTWWCYLRRRTGVAEHAAELDRATPTRLLTLPGDLLLDVHPDDDDE